MTAAEWIKAINAEESDLDVLRLWRSMINRNPDNTADEITLEVHESCVDRVLNALGYSREDESR